MVKLDYGASVPINMAAPFSVNVDPNKPPGDRFKDYIPREKVEAATTKPKNTLKDAAKKPYVKYDRDYISNSETKELKKAETSRIDALAKLLYNKSKEKHKEYTEAKAIIDAATPEEKANPGAELTRAMRIVKKVKPLTKEEAIEEATRQHYGHRS